MWVLLGSLVPIPNRPHMAYFLTAFNKVRNELDPKPNPNSRVHPISDERRKEAYIANMDSWNNILHAHGLMGKALTLDVTRIVYHVVQMS